MTPIRLYTYQTPNGHKASIMLEETGLPYEVEIVDIEKGEQRRPEFLALNPNGKIPVIVVPDRDQVIVESGAILLYLAERSGRLQARDEAEARVTLQWMLFQAAHVGPTLGQLWNYKVFAEQKIPFVIDRFTREAERILRVLDGRLADSPFIVGASFGTADIMTWPWIRAARNELGLLLDPYPNLSRWYEAVAKRPAVQRGLRVPRLAGKEVAA